MSTQTLSLKTILQHKFGTGGRTLSERITSKEITGFQIISDSNFASDAIIEDIAVTKLFAIFCNNPVKLTINKIVDPEDDPESTQVIQILGLYIITPTAASLLITIENPDDEPVAFNCYYS